jgi:sulfatase modifying factor 1
MSDRAPPVHSDAGIYVPSRARSCALPDGGALVLPNGDSPCVTIVVPGGTFPMGRSENGTDKASPFNPMALPEHAMAVSTFALDKYEVTVGRFRNFVQEYAAGWRPGTGAGTNDNVPIPGDASVNGTGWQTKCDDSATGLAGSGTSLPVTGADASATLNEFSHRLGWASGSPTWTDVPGPNESLPIHQVNCYEAFAFCVWDAARLSTEAEWEYAAAGGDENRLYSWGSALPDCSYANIWTGDAFCGPNGAKFAAPLGSSANDGSRWGHQDLIGNVWEWVLDSYELYAPSQSDNYANTSFAAYRVVRGGWYGAQDVYARAASLAGTDGRDHMVGAGLRCARNVE